MRLINSGPSRDEKAQGEVVGTHYFLEKLTAHSLTSFQPQSEAASKPESSLT